jgi:hypothetical protein
VWGASVGLGGAGSSAILAGACCGGHVGWLWLGLWDGVEVWVLYALGDGGEGPSGWVMGFVLVRGLGRAFVWVASSGLSSGLEHGGCQMLGSNSRGLLDHEHQGKVRRWVRVR